MKLTTDLQWGEAINIMNDYTPEHLNCHRLEILSSMKGLVQSITKDMDYLTLTRTIESLKNLARFDDLVQAATITAAQDEAAATENIVTAFDMEL